MNVSSFDSQICRNLEHALSREWIETNQLGSYASSTFASINTNRHHGLFVPQLKPPLGQHVLLSQLEEILYIDEVAYPLSSCLYEDNVVPEGYRNIHEFLLHPFPSWTYRLEDLIFKKSLVLMYDEQTLIVRYRLLSGDPNFVRLEIKPLTPFRNVHSLAQMNNRMNTKLEVLPARINFAGLHFHHQAAIVDQSGGWYQHIFYPQDKEKGMDFKEDLYYPFRLVYTFLNENDVYFCVSIDRWERFDPSSLFSREEARRLRQW